MLLRRSRGDNSPRATVRQNWHYRVFGASSPRDNTRRELEILPTTETAVAPRVTDGYLAATGRVRGPRT